MNGIAASGAAARALCGAGEAEAVRVRKDATPEKTFRGLRYSAVLVACHSSNVLNCSLLNKTALADSGRIFEREKKGGK